MRQVNFFDILAPSAPAKETDVSALIAKLTHNCRECRLGQTTDRGNQGFLCAGPIEAKIAILGDMPEVGGHTLTKHLPLYGPALGLLKMWLIQVSIDPDTVFLLNTVQCKTTKVGKAGEDPREPYDDEVDLCFPSRALRVLKALPNLEIVITLGWLAASVLLGKFPTPRPKTHEGAWFGTDVLPNVAIFCLDHPRSITPEDVRHLGRCEQYMEYLRSEYLRPDPAHPGRKPKILDILAYRQKGRNAQRQHD